MLSDSAHPILFHIHKPDQHEQPLWLYQIANKKLLWQVYIYGQNVMNHAGTAMRENLLSQYYVHRISTLFPSMQPSKM